MPSSTHAGLHEPHIRRQAVEAAASRRINPAVADAIVSQNEPLAESSARHAHLDALSRPGTVAVVTGQQVGLFLGPLYTFYKAASTIVVARALAEESGRPCVPVFWMATEDHDFAEIATCTVADRHGAPCELTIDDTRAHPCAPVASATLSPRIEDTLAQLTDTLSHLPESSRVLGLLRRHYRPGATPGRAFAGTLAEIFADDGLVIVDPRDPALLPAAGPVHEQALRQAEPVATSLSEHTRALSASGAATPVHVREGAPLSFYHPDGMTGPRYRLAPRGDGWSLVGADRTVSREEALRAVRATPERFSTSALLRPLLQDTWLPTAAYIAGPSEQVYLAQAEPLYRFFNLSPPLILPRARFRILGATERRLCEQLGLRPDDAIRPRAELLARLGDGVVSARTDEDEGTPTSVLPHEGGGGHVLPGGGHALPSGGHARPDPEELRRRLLGPLRAPLSALADVATDLDGGLLRSTRKTEETVTRAVERLIDRYRRSLARRDAITCERLDRLRAMLAPGGEPQERVHGFPMYAARWGLEEFRGKVLEGCVPFDGSLRDLCF